MCKNRTLKLETEKEETEVCKGFLDSAAPLPQADEEPQIAKAGLKPPKDAFIRRTAEEPQTGKAMLFIMVCEIIRTKPAPDPGMAPHNIHKLKRALRL